MPLTTLGRWRIGGPADLVITPKNAAELTTTLANVARAGLPHVVIGDGSNLLFDDAGFRGVIIRIGRDFAHLTMGEDGIVTAGAGLWVPSFVRKIMAHGMAGATHAIGIPGTLGGLVTMNGGSQRRGIGEHVVSVDVVDVDGKQRRMMPIELNFAYRTSSLQANGAIVVSARFHFAAGDPAALRREALGILASRRAKFPKIRANCGSVFVSDPSLYDLVGPPGAAIERVGLKGFAIGDAQISPDHANFIVNNGRARSADVLALIGLARRRVYDLTGIAMNAEVRHLASDGTLRPAHEVFGSANPF
ncbi:UDP-N-acetylmuramate dehydrogenase [Sphingomonas sp. PB2P19]|uniref:UDP-N-acetylmuramate dehydrogenase n=1 Tax=Sphingomonas rhamnosi TaxID=3096156 RepID=UPI002FC7DC59